MEKMDVISMGEILIDFTPAEGERTYTANPGGAPANVAISMARNGLSVGMLGKLGRDDFGRLLVKTMEADGVKLLCPELTDEAVTTLAFVTLYEGGERSFTFVRKPGADILLSEDDVHSEDIMNCTLFHAGSVSMSDNPSREAVVYAMRMASHVGKLVSFDINYRPMIWSKTECKVQVERILPYVDLLKVSDEELDFVGGEAGIANFMMMHNITVVIETLGSKGAKYYFKDRMNGNVYSGMVEGRHVDAVDATGAGDAFWGGFLSKLLIDGVTAVADVTEEKVKAALAYGNASGALCVQQKGGIPALPTREAIEKLLGTE